MAQRLTVQTLGQTVVRREFDGDAVYVFEGDFAATFEEIRDYVQVEFLGTGVVGPTYYARGNLYTYIDPGLGLKVGDLVDVPTKYEDHNVAIVRKLGPGDAALALFVVKEVTARYYREEAQPAYANGYARSEVAWGDNECGPEYGCFCGDQPCPCNKPSDPDYLDGYGMKC